MRWNSGQYREPNTIGILRLNPGLLFQITVRCYCESVPIAERMVTLAKELCSPELALSQRRFRSRLLLADETLNLLVRCTNCPMEQATAPPILERLCESSWRLIQHKSYVMDHTLSLCNAATRALDLGRGCIKRLQALQLGDLSEAPPLARALGRLAGTLNSVGLAVRHSVLIFQDDENVLLFLLRMHTTLDAALSRCKRAGTTKSLLASIHQDGLDGLEKQLRRRYSRRGFHELVPRLKEALNELRYPCPTPETLIEN